MRITRATNKGLGQHCEMQGYGTNRERSIDRRHGLVELDPDAFLLLEQGHRDYKKKKRRITLPEVSILRTASDGSDKHEEKEMAKGSSDWHEEAKRRRAAGEGPSSIAKDFGVSPSRVSQVTATGEQAEKYKANAEKALERLRAAKKEKSKAKAEALASAIVKKEPVKPVVHKEQEAMTDRTFEPAKSVDSTDQRPGVRIRCSSCSESMVWRKHGTIHPVHAARVFRNAGWIVGAGPRADKCPTCKAKLYSHSTPKPAAKPEPVKDLKELAAAISAKEAVQEAPAPVVETPHPIQKFDATAVPSRPAATPSSEMSKADRRVIIAKLEDVYLDENTGYKGDWTDEKVAADLGVSILWVEELREQNFGPAKNVALLAKQMEELLAFGAKIAATAKGIQSVVDEIDARIKDYDTRVETFEADLARFNELHAALQK